jgi:hypothetical protein
MEVEQDGASQRLFSGDKSSSVLYIMGSLLGYQRGGRRRCGLVLGDNLQNLQRRTILYPQRLVPAQ